VSGFGRMIDPIADKLLVHAALTGKVMPPTKLAKWKTAFEMAAIAVLIVWVVGLAVLPFAEAVPQITHFAKIAGLALLWIAAFLSVYTGSLYLRAAVSE